VRETSESALPKLDKQARAIGLGLQIQYFAAGSSWPSPVFPVLAYWKAAHSSRSTADPPKKAGDGHEWIVNLDFRFGTFRSFLDNGPRDGDSCTSTRLPLLLGVPLDTAKAMSTNHHPMVG
jgi:hypothetical protein